MKRFAAAVLIGLVLLAGAYGIYRRSSAAPRIRVLGTARVERGEVRSVLVATGILKPREGAEVKIGARATGVIRKLSVQIGDPVKKGQLLAVIDDREQKESVEAKEASLAAAKEALAQVERTYPERIREARARYDYARITYERERKLIRSEYTTQEAVDQARSDFETTQAQLKRIREEYETQRNMALARVREAEAALRQERIRLSYTRILAPIDGVVSELNAIQGETIVTGLQVANLVTILDPTRLEMRVYVDETDIGKVFVRQPVEYYVDAFPEKVFQGEVAKIRPQPVVKDNIVYYLVVVPVKRSDALLLKPEMTAYVKMLLQEKKGVLRVPNGAVKLAGGKQVVYRVSKGGEVQKVPVVLGIQGEEKTEIVSGLGEGDRVATKIVLPDGSGS